MYDWNVKLIELNKKDKFKELNTVLKRFKIYLNKEDVKDISIKVDENYTGGGCSLIDSMFRIAVILIYPQENKADGINTLCHEKRHLEDEIIIKHDLNGEIEAAAYLAGYLAEKLLF